MEQIYNPEPLEKKRPVALVILPVLTYIGSAIMLMIMLLFASENFRNDFLEMAYQMNYDESILLELQVLLEIPSWFFYFASGSIILTVVGATLMLRMEKIGFHIFVISKLLLFGIGVIFGKGFFSLDSAYFIGSVLFTLLYFLQLKNIKKI